uniref:ATP-dependent RNA helicase TDRD9 n=1 Tax=Oryzias melastigma TaxID=30732 RepID=A0A3B3BJJ2_ORYME
MEKTFTPEQISDWFCSGASFAKFKLSEKSSEIKSDEPSSKAISSPDEDDQECSGGKIQEPEDAKSTVPPSINHEYQSLPITKDRRKLISFIENNSVVIIRGATGSGKTTQLPQYILDHYNGKNSPCKIAVTQPRKIGATSIARWVSKQRKSTLGDLVGYQVGLEKKASDQTQLIYVTTGVLLQKLVSAKCLTEFSHIFVDEVHERSEEMDFLLLVLKKFLHSNSRYIKIILMSAAINCKEFAEYFSTPVCGRMIPAHVFEVEGAPYAIEEFYLDDLHKLFSCRIKSSQSDSPCIPEEMYSVATSLIQSFDEMEGKDSCKNKDEKGVPERGSVLVFLPGINEINSMQAALAKLLHKRLQVFPLHSTVTLEEQNNVFLTPIPGCRKVILSTNIAESSVTVPDVKYVIDFCLVRHLVCDPETNYQSLHLTWASKTNCNQRKGRAGRVSKGYCYRLVTKAFWKTEIPEYMTPEMLLAPLSSIMLKVKLLDIGDPCSLLSTALSPPSVDNIVRTVLQLKEIGALSVKTDGNDQNYDGELTFLGRVLAHLPVDLHLGKMIVLGHVFGCLDECLIIAASQSLKNMFTFPYLHQLAGHRSKLAFAGGSQSDSIALVNAFKTWYLSKKKGELRQLKDELNWGKENFIQIKSIREVAELYDELKRRVSQFNMHVTEDTQPSDYTSTHKQRFILQVVIAGAYYPNYFVQKEIDEQMATKDMCGLNPQTTVMVKTIYFENSRAFVEFSNASGESEGLSEVSLALLSARQGSPMEISVHPTGQIEAFAADRPVSHLKYGRLTADIQTLSVTPIEIGSSTADLEKLPPTRFFIVNVTEVVDVGHFWGYPSEEQNLAKKRNLTAEINSRTLNPVTRLLHPNMCVLAPYGENAEHSLYYRAKVLHISATGVEVFFVDFGNKAVVASKSLREIPPDLLSHPFQAMEFQLAGMSPSARSMILGNKWSTQARNDFLSLVKGQLVLVSVYSIVHGVIRVDLLINMESKEISVVDILVENGHAVKTEESCDSKQSHEVLMSVYKDKQDGTYVPNSVGSAFKERTEEDKELIHNLLCHFSKRQNTSSKKLQLQGPLSSYMTNFYSLSQMTSYRTVSISRSSINSIALNDSPHLKHMRMLVAGTVSVTATGSSILLSDTSLLPNIPGLPALVTMLFTPIMELRTDKERTCYTGALCGLGYNSQTKEVILPEHDIELEFDVRFDVEDIIEINALRMAINSLLCDGEKGTLHLRPDRISQLQEDCRERLIRLFTKSPPREPITPPYNESRGKWNQVDPSLWMNFAEEGSSNNRGDFLKLHPVTLLNS